VCAKNGATALLTAVFKTPYPVYLYDFGQTSGSLDLNPVDYFVWGRCNRWCAVTKFRTFINWNAC